MEEIKNDLNKFLDSDSSWKLGISLLTVPFYLSMVDLYQSKIVERISVLQIDTIWGIFGVLCTLVGVMLIFSNIGFKEHDSEISKIFNRAIGILLFISISWLMDEKWIAYVMVLFWAVTIYLLVEVLHRISDILRKYFSELETNYQLMIAIPIITICLNYLLKI